MKCIWRINQKISMDLKFWVITEGYLWEICLVICEPWSDLKRQWRVLLAWELKLDRRIEKTGTANTPSADVMSQSLCTWFWLYSVWLGFTNGQFGCTRNGDIIARTKQVNTIKWRSRDTETLSPLLTHSQRDSDTDLWCLLYVTGLLFTKR